MAETEQEERSEEATQQRREDFRHRGQVAQTRELGSVFMLIASLGVLWSLGTYFWNQIHLLFSRSFEEFMASSVREGNLTSVLQFVSVRGVMIVLPVFLVMWIFSLFSSVIQIGFINNEEALKFDLNRMNPVEGFRRIMSLRAVVEGIKALIKVLAISFVIALILQNEVKHIPHLIHFSPHQLLLFSGRVIVKLFGGIALFMGVLALGDYFFQRWELEKKMRMTKQEVKEELKSREGDPLIKARIRRIQREMAHRRMMEDVPKADVIVTNPTHIAVALQYDEKSIAPRVVAKGADFIAEKIKEKARLHQVPIVENKPLARTLFKTLKIGQVIPRELYTAVAEILSYVFKLKKKAVNTHG